MTTWRVGRRNPHTVYRQHGDEPRGYEHDDHDDSLGYFRFPADAKRAVDAVNAEHARATPRASISLDETRETRERTTQIDDDPAALLRLAATGRREYAESGGPNRELLLHEAGAYEQAALIVEGDLWALQGALPSWRWMQIPDSYTQRGLYGSAERDPVILASHPDLLLHEQVRAVLDEEGVEGLADAIRRVARGETT